MSTMKLEKPTWHDYFDRMSKVLIGKRAEIEVDSLSLGSQIDAEWLPLLGIVYDTGNDTIEITLEGVDHMIRKPQEIYVDQNAAELTSMEVTDGDGARQIVKLRDTLMLPSP